MGHKKDVYDIDVHGEIQKVVVTLVVIRHFCILPGAPTACAGFCDPTAISRFKHIVYGLVLRQALNQRIMYKAQHNARNQDALMEEGKKKAGEVKSRIERQVDCQLPRPGCPFV